MASLLYQGVLKTGLSEAEAQSTVEPIRTDGDGAEMDKAPEWNQADKETDDSGQLIGLSPRVMGAHKTDSEQSVPQGVIFGDYDAQRDGLQGVEDQIASSGHAAALEAQGIRGHGTLRYDSSIEPLNPANVYGNDYFTANSLSANEGSGAYMMPPENDNWPQKVAQAQANKASRDAFMSTQYDAFFQGS